MDKNWTTATLDQLISENGIFSDGDWVEKKDQDPDGDVRLIQLSDIGDGFFRDRSNRFLNKKRANELSCTFLKKGDILIARMPEPLGRATLFPFEGNEKYVTAVDVAIVRIANRYVSDLFLLNAINSPQIRQQIEQYKTGTTRKRISRKNLSKIKFQIPPLPEQRAIVAKLEQLFSELEDGVANLQKAQQQLKVYRQAVLKKAFEGELTREWRAQQTGLPTAEVLLAQIQAERERYYEEQLTEWKQAVADWEAEGKVGKKPRKPIFTAEVEPFTKEELELLSPLAKAWCWSKLINVAECLDRFRIPINKKQRAMRKGDVPYYGANGQVGWIDEYIFDEELVIVVEDETFTGRKIPFSYKISGKSWVNNHAHVLRGIKKVLDTDYLNYGLMYYPFVPLTTGTTGRKKLTQKALMNAPFQVCSLPEQHQIVQEIESRLSVCDQLEQDIEANLKRSERLRQSLLQKAFAGELLTEAELEACRAEPDWESAEKLLERIKGETK